MILEVWKKAENNPHKLPRPVTSVHIIEEVVMIRQNPEDRALVLDLEQLWKMFQENGHPSET